jgi:hypothetical protein
MVGRFRWLFLGALCVLVCAPSAFAGNPAGGLPTLNHARTKQVAALVDRFVKDVVLRENLADGWTISGPALRGNTMRKAWVAGHGVSVERAQLVGHDWAHAWLPTCEGYRSCGVRNELGLDLYFHVGHGKNAQLWDEEMTLDKIHGKWVVNGLYTQAVFRLGKGHQGSCLSSDCAITGPGDLKAGSGAANANAPAPLGDIWLWVVIGLIVGIPLTVLLVYVIRSRRLNRRAWEAYVKTERA